MAQFVRRCAKGIDAAVEAAAAAAWHIPRLILDEDHFGLCSGVSKGKLKESHRGGAELGLPSSTKNLKVCDPVHR